MRVAVVSDVHGNLTALEAVLADLRETAPDAVFHGGDLLHSVSRPADVADLVRDLGWHSLISAFDRSGILGDTRLQTVDFALVHASPGDLWRAPAPTADDTELARTYGPLSHKVVIYAHIHSPFVRHLAALTVANTGSVSLSLDSDNRASYLLLDSGFPHIRRVAYDIDAEAKILRSSGIPHADWIAQCLYQATFVKP